MKQYWNIDVRDMILINEKIYEYFDFYLGRDNIIFLVRGQGEWNPIFSAVQSGLHDEKFLYNRTFNEDQ